MRFGKIFLAASAATLTIGFANVAGPADAASKPAKEPKYSNPAPISAKEKQQGAEAHKEILTEFGGAYEAPQTAYVQRVAKKIAVQSGLGNAESDFTVTFLNSSVNNAFALPGGYIYITRQLAGLCNSEAEMAGVLGHEVGHVAARHSAKRQKQATIANIIGVLATIGGAAIGDNGGLAGMLGSGLKNYSGTVAQLFTLSYSRGQEEEADDLGIRYLSKAGYDPTALSSMLSTLALQTSLDARVAGQGDAFVPEWASTHPDPAKRVVRAATNAKPYPVSSVRNQDAHFAAINGMMYDDDPAQGVVEGQQFLHRDLKIKFTAPAGFGMQNSPTAVSINGTGGQAIFTTQAYNGDRNAYVAAAFKAVVGDQQSVNYGPVSQTTVNGIPAFYAQALVSTQSGQRKLTVFAYELGTNSAFHFVTVSAADSSPFDAMYSSFARMTASEAAAVKARKIKIVSVAKNDTVATLASKMAYSNFQTDRFLALNGMRSDVKLTPGQKVKIVTY